MTVSLQPIKLCGFCFGVHEYEYSESDAIVLFSPGVMIWLQPMKTNFSVKAVWTDYNSLPKILQFWSQIEELKKEKMLYQKRGTVYFRFSSFIPISEENFGLHLMCILMPLGKGSGLYMMNVSHAQSLKSFPSVSALPWAHCLHGLVICIHLAFTPFLEAVENKVIKGNRQFVLWQCVCWKIY